jgi:hypothetical protein
MSLIDFFHEPIWPCMPHSLFIGPPFCALKAHALLLYTTIKEVVAQGYTYAGWTYPVPAILALLK